MFDYSGIWSGLSRQVILCVGDCMLDEFVYGEVSRISPEAPTLVMAVRRTEVMAGGAANVARNIAALGATCIFIGLVGRDDAAATLTSALQQEPRVEPILVVDESRATTRKSRFVSEHFSTHLLRADWENARPAADAIEDELIDRIRFALPRARALVLSDYAKGVLTPRVIAAAIAGAKAAGIPVIVDPKGSDFSVYRGAQVITPNRGELAAAAQRPATTDAEVEEAARVVLEQTGCESVLVTRSDQGMSVVPRDGTAMHIAALPVKVHDVSGAGDTVVAALATLLSTGVPLDAAARAANAAASVVVGKRGTATVSADELRARILPHAALVSEEKIALTDAALMQRVEGWRRQGLRVGFTNGCFDLLHPGHVKVLTQARAACDRLIVGLNSDESVRRLKGETRPIQSEQARAEVLAALEAVDVVTVFAEDTPLRLIELVRPDVLVKGGDWSADAIVGRDLVEAAGGEIVIVSLAQGFSTTNIARRIATGGGRS